MAGSSRASLFPDAGTFYLSFGHAFVVFAYVVSSHPFVFEQRTENVERFHIMFAIQLIRCPFLNPRIRGVTFLSEIIDITVRNAAR